MLTAPQEAAWHDEERNSTGALCSRLSGDASQVQGATGARIGSLLQVSLSAVYRLSDAVGLLQGLAGIIIATSLGVYYSLPLGLTAATFFPFLIGAAFLHMKVDRLLCLSESRRFDFWWELFALSLYLARLR